MQLDMARDVQRFEVSNKLRKFGIVFRFELLVLCKLENELKKLHNFEGNCTNPCSVIVMKGQPTVTQIDRNDNQWPLPGSLLETFV